MIDEDFVAFGARLCLEHVTRSGRRSSLLPAKVFRGGSSVTTLFRRDTKQLPQ
jgi:hypothetical protein